VIGGAGAVVSDNTRDLPATRIPPGIVVLDAVTFARDTVSVSPRRAQAALARMVARYRDPRREVPEVVDALEQRYGWVEAADLLRSAA
jgi:hypothetical protein